MSEAGAPVLTESLMVTLWREAIRTGPDEPDACDLLDWSAILAAAGAEAEARLLRDCAAVLRGFAPAAAAERQAGTGPNPVVDETASAPASGWTTVAASHELERLAQACRETSAPTLTQAARPSYSGYANDLAGIEPDRPEVALSGDIAAVARTLVAELGGPGSDHDPAPLRTSLDMLVELDRRLPLFDYRRYAGGPLQLLCSAIAQGVLTGFALATRDLWGAPLGSITFFRETARLDDAALGPYLRNVGLVVRHARDVYDMARLASHASGRGDDRDARGAWIALLSRSCSDHLFAEIIDDLGDYSAGATLGAILDRITSRPVRTIDLYMVRRIRDAALDAGDYALAARAQQAIAMADGYSWHEQLILGEILASGGEFLDAEGIFRHLRDMRPHDEHVALRLTAVMRDDFAAHQLLTGFHSPQDRLDTRLYHRGIPAGYPRRKGLRIAAVDVS